MGYQCSDCFYFVTVKDLTLLVMATQIKSTTPDSSRLAYRCDPSEGAVVLLATYEGLLRAPLKSFLSQNYISHRGISDSFTSASTMQSLLGKVKFGAAVLDEGQRIRYIRNKSVSCIILIYLPYSFFPLNH